MIQIAGGMIDAPTAMVDAHQQFHARSTLPGEQIVKIGLAVPNQDDSRMVRQIPLHSSKSVQPALAFLFSHRLLIAVSPFADAFERASPHELIKQPQRRAPPA